MNADRLLSAISNIDSRYIDEAAYELGAKAVSDKSVDEKIVSIHKKQRIRKMILIALPSVAAILLIVSVALPALLRLGKSNAAATAEAPAAASEAASEAAAEATEEPSYDADAEAPAYEAEPSAPAYEAEVESPAVEAAGEATESADESRRDDKTSQSLNADTSVPMLSAKYTDGILTINIQGIEIADLSDLRYTISRADTPSHEGVIAEGPLSDLTDQTNITGDELILDLSDISLDPGDHCIDLGSFTAEFTVPGSSNY